MKTAETPTAPAQPSASSPNQSPANSEGNELQSLTFKQTLERKLNFSVLKTLGLSKLVSLASEAFASEDSHEETLDAVKAARRSEYKPAGKVLAALQVSFETDLANADIRHGTTFAAWYEEKLDRKYDAGRAAQCARVFRKLVVPGHLPESDYDYVATDWLEKTSKIIDLVTKKGLDMTSDVMLDVINILKVRSDEGAKQLRLIKNKLEGKETVTSDGKGPELNAPAFVAILKRGLSMNFPIGGRGLLLAMTEIIGIANSAKTLPADVAKQFYFASLALGDAFAALPVEKVEAWTSEKEKNNASVKVAPAPDFIAWLKSAYANMTDNEALEAADDLFVFYEQKKRLPANVDEFDAWMNNAPAAKVAA